MTKTNVGTTVNYKKDFTMALQKILTSEVILLINLISELEQESSSVDSHD